MKIRNLILTALCLPLLFALPSQLYGQKNKLTPEDIPDAVIQSLDYEHPGVKVLSWTLDNNDFVASFKDEGAMTKAYFSNSGEWLKTLTAVSKKELPSTISDYVQKNYDNYLISAAYLQQKPNVKMHYMIEAREDAVGAKPSILTFTADGDLMERIDPEGAAPKAPKPQADKPVAQNQEKAEKPEKAEKSPKPEKQPKQPKEEQKKKEDNAIDAASVPAAVTKALTKKAQRPEDLKWYLKDTVYIAKCTTKAQANEIYITQTGIWQKTLIELAEEQVTGNMLKHIKEYYKGYKFANATKELRSDKQDKFYVSIYEKANYKQKLKTTIIFDKTGKLIKTIEADVNMEAYETKEDKSLDRYYAKMDKAEGVGELKPKELPSAIQSYVSLNYPSYIYKSCTLVADDDFGEVYRIVVKADGISNMSETLFFNKEGKFLKKERGGADDEGYAGGGASSDVPAAVEQAFKTKYPRVASPIWNELDGGKYEVNFNSTKGKTICVFDSEGALLETHTSMNPENITPNIETYLKQNAKGAKVIEYYSVIKSDKKKYYKVVIKPKKSTETETLWFNNAGKFIEE